MADALLHSLQHSDALRVRRRKRATRAQADPKKMARKAGGGAWRAFLHQQHGGGRFSSDLGARFRDLSPESRRFYERMGQQASAAHRVGGQSFPKFRAVNAAAVDPEEPLTEDKLSLGSQPSSAEDLRRYMDDCGCSFQKQRRAEARAKKELLATRVKLLQDANAEKMRDLQPFYMTTPPVTVHSVPSAGSSLHTFLDAKKVAAESSPFLSLADAWTERHRGLVAKPILQEEPLNRRPCLRAGFCCCAGDGVQTFLLQKQALGSLRRAFPAGSALQAKLVAGDIILQWASALASDNTELEAIERYTHASVQSLKPFMPTLTELERTGPQHFKVMADTPTASGLTKPKLWCFASFCRTLSHMRKWTLSVLLLGSSGERLPDPTLEMYRVVAESLEEIRPDEFWSGPEPRPQSLEELLEAEAGSWPHKSWGLVCRGLLPKSMRKLWVLRKPLPQRLKWRFG